MIDPITAIPLAARAVSEGGAKEIEMEWTDSVGESEQRLVITVRQEVKHFVTRSDS